MISGFQTLIFLTITKKRMRQKENKNIKDIGSKEHTLKQL